MKNKNLHKGRFNVFLGSMLDYNKAPMGFEPMNQGFADPSIRPL